MLQPCKTRLVADKSVTVGDVSAALGKFMDASGKYNIRALLANIETLCTWKSAARLEMLVNSAPLYREFFSLYKNSVIASSTTSLALEHYHYNVRPCIFVEGGTTIKDEAIIISGIIRMGAVHWRNIKGSQKLLATALQKVNHIYI